MNIFKRVSRWFDSFIGDNAGHNPSDDMFNRDMWDYYSGNAVPCNASERKQETGTARTAGHLSCQGGLRGHSVGDVFPYVPYFRGKNGEQVWVHCPGGEQLGPFDTQEQMYDALNFL